MTPRRTLASEGVLEPGNNAFGLLRLVLAALVIVSHSWSLGGHGREPLFELSGGTTLGFLAVTGFFGLSGALVARSAERTAPAAFLLNRARRILPGYWACLAVTAFGFAPLLCALQDLPLEMLSSSDGASARAYVVNNFPLRIEQNRIGQVLWRLPYSGAINGSLWSLPYEFVAYLVVLLLVRAWLRAGRSALFLAALLGVALVLAVLVAREDASFLALPLPLFGALDAKLFWFLLAVFLSGSALALWRERVPFSPLSVAVVSALFVASLPLGLFKPWGGLLFPYVVLGLGRYLPRALRGIGTRADLSYGLYLYGFPVGQTVVAAGLPQAGGLALAAWSLLFTAPLAAASWFGIERRFLR